jgi:hypothetical protein
VNINLLLIAEVRSSVVLLALGNLLAIQEIFYALSLSDDWNTTLLIVVTILARGPEAINARMINSNST